MGPTAIQALPFREKAAPPAQTAYPGAWVGVEPIQRVVMMEDHDKAYHAWRESGIRDRIVVHVDAHMDFGWVPERDPAELLQLRSLRELEQHSRTASFWNLSRNSSRALIHIGNYLNPALREGILESFYWVVPDEFVRSPQQRARLQDMVETLHNQRPHVVGAIQWAGRSLSATIYGKPMVICAASDLPQFDEMVLLDIDTDYLIVDSITGAYPLIDPAKVTPWIWPDELILKLKERRLRTDFVTIAYSVEGGYTPLGYKYLGDDLADRLRDPNLAGSEDRLSRLKRQGALRQAEGRHTEARRAYEEALAENPNDPSVHYQIARLSYDQHNEANAYRSYQRAIALDPTYMTSHGNFGPVYQGLGRLEEAEAEYRRMLTFEPHHAEAYGGLGDLRSYQGRWDEAIQYYRRALAVKPQDGHTRLGLGYAHVKRRDWSAAEEHLSPAAAFEDCAVRAQYWLGHVLRKQGRWQEALVAYRAAKRLGLRHMEIYLRLAWLYGRKRNFYQAARHGREAMRLGPAVLRSSLRRLRAKIRKQLARTPTDD